MSDRRFFDNPYKDYTGKDDNVVQLQQNQIHPECLELIKSSSNKLLKILEENLLSVNLKDMSVYTGTTGVAYLYLLLAERVDESYLQKAIGLINSSLSKLRKRDISFMCGDAGPLALGAVLFDKTKDETKSKDCVKRLISYLPRVLDVSSQLPDELLYGRVGYLYSLLFVNKYINNAVSSDVVKQVLGAVITSGQNLAHKERRPVPLFYEWYEEYYLGGAHGFAGIVYLLLQAREHLSGEQLGLVRTTVDYLLSIRYPSGNFPSSLGSTTDKLVHWCHGAPGFVQMLSLAGEVYNDDKYTQAAVQCGEVVWSRGLLRKGYGICHGVAGNAYTFLTLYQSTKDMKHLYRACKFAEWCSSYNRYQDRPPDRPFSLFEGLAGTVYFMYDVQTPLAAKFPAFTI